MNPKLFCSVKTDIGKKYEQNEDFYFLPAPLEKLKITPLDIEKGGNLYLVCDGMGGANAGEVASELTAGWVAQSFYQNDIGGTICDKLKTIISRVNTKIYKLAREHQQYSGMCTTVLAAHICDSTLSICSVGDSRAYLFREEKLTQMSEDQSPLWSLYKNGSITKEEMRTHPRSNLLLRAIGYDVVLDEADIFHCEETLHRGDLVLLCSDGLSDMIPDEEIENILKLPATLDEKTGLLIDLANENGGRDNITAVLIEYQ